MPNPKPKTRRPLTLLTDEEVTRLIKACEKGFTGWRLRAMIIMMYRAGLRISEACALNVEDLTFNENGTISVIVQCGKRRNRRTTFVDPDGAQVIKVYMAKRARQMPHADRGFMFPVRSGQRIPTRVEVYNCFKAAALRAGITKRCHPHALRHMCAINMYRHGISLVSIRNQLGHVSIATTDLYLRMLDPGELGREVMTMTWNGLLSLTKGGTRKLEKL